MTSPGDRQKSVLIVTLLLGLVAAVLLGEGLLRLVLPAPTQFYVWPPHLAVEFFPTPTVTPGIEGISRFHINASGVRGEDFAETQTERILTIGGSTTECLFLDDEETWPALLQRALTDSKSRYVWVGNVGKSGQSTRDHLLQIKYLLAQYPPIQTVVALVGINDLHVRLTDPQYDPHYPLTPGFEAYQRHHAFVRVPLTTPVYHYSRLGWWRLATNVKRAYQTRTTPELPIQDVHGQMYVEWRENRRQAVTILDGLPDLTSGLEEYRRNLHAMVDLAQQRGVRVVFVTQPTMWTATLTDAEKELLWLGWTGHSQSAKGRPYYSIAVLDQAMTRYNETLLGVCHERYLFCVDLARLVPRNTTTFYDDVHFNEAGARRVAQVLADHLR